MGGSGWLVWADGAVALACFGSGLWAAIEFFDLGSRVPLRATAWFAVTLLAWIWFARRVIAFGVGNKALFAMVVMVAALALFWWAAKTTSKHRIKIAFSPDRPHYLCERGPYRFIRHPFYLSHILCWVGTSLATHGWLSWVVPAVVLMVSVGLALQEERGFRASEFSDAYLRYRRRTGMFIPSLRFARATGLTEHA